ncbi:murein L,D-transpeptidase catalytic domain family protein [Dysgonomonas sp. OttesenSCG-928-M03]|nr:murein L,D-transpeptidase catalytic domain family protein [Dysgonomonas sp. OttesenSCG-928-M03]
MTKVLKIFLAIFFIFTCIPSVYLFASTTTPEETISLRLNEKAEEALSFCKKNGYNTDFCILIDMKVHSGKHRMFIWNFKERTIDKKALCAHGCGKNDKKSTGAHPIFSNVNGSLLSSLGKYKIGARSGSQWGIKIHYKMHGLETTNNNAFKRIIVLHSHTPVPETEIYPTHLPMGWSFGCPVTDNKTMTYLDNRLKNTKKPVLLWIYN